MGFEKMLQRCGCMAFLLMLACAPAWAGVCRVTAERCARGRTRKRWRKYFFQYGDLVDMNLRICRFVSFALIVALAVAAPAHAQDGAYDPNFGTVGRTWIDVTSDNIDRGLKLMRLPSGNLFMAGYCKSGHLTCAAWLTPSGSKATGFGASGSGSALFSDYTGWPPDAYTAEGVAAFADGRIAIAAGKPDATTELNYTYLALLRADGTGLDPAVGNGAGYVSRTTPTAELLMTPQQQLIVVGTSGSQSPISIVVSRYDSTFHLDTSFGTNGSATLGFAQGDAHVYGATLQRDGKIVVIGGTGSNAFNGNLFIARLTAGGDPDPDFGINSDGRYASNYGNTHGLAGFDIVEDEKGRLVFAGYISTPDGSGTLWLVNRLLSGGAIDTSFNGGQPQEFVPVFPSDTASLPQACCIALQSDNRIVVAGRIGRGNGGYYFAMARFWETGTFDSTWGGGGQSYGDMSTQANVATDTPRSLLIVPGRVIVGGSTTASGEIRFTATGMQIDLLFAADFE